LPIDPATRKPRMAEKPRGTREELRTAVSRMDAM
jgi:hypothetical protein